jgi:hypothetical protein
MITATFTDPQGTVQTDAILCLRNANYYNNTNEFYALNTSNFTDVTNEPANNVVNITCSFYYWINAAAKASASAPYILANSNEMDMDFNFTPDATYDGLTLQAKCEKHLVDVVLPPMQA